jgi:hypothetical protein
MRPASSSSVRPSRASSVTNVRAAKALSPPRVELSFIESALLPLKDILETLALLAEGVRISSLSRAKGFKEDTILSWLRQAARHSEAVEEVLLADYELSKAQVDGLWAYVGNKGQKGDMRSARIVENSGAVR